QPLERRPVGLVVVALAALVLHDVALVVEVGLGERRGERAHPVGLQPERELQVADGHGLVVVRALERGAGVERGAGALQQRGVLAFGDVRGALEHQVLEEVGESGSAGPLMPRPHPVPEVHGCQWYDMVLADHHAQAIAERVLMQRLFCHGALPSVRWVGWRTAPRASAGRARAAGLISVSPYRVPAAGRAPRRTVDN